MAESSPFHIVFDVYHLYHLPQFEPVIDLLSSDDRFNVTLTVSAEIKKPEYELIQKILKAKNNQVIFSDNEDDRAKQIKSSKPDVFICGWSRYELDKFVPESTIVGMIYHGIGVKPSYWLDNHPRLDLRFVEGPLRKEQLRKHNVETDLILTGFAKLDPIFNGLVSPRKKVLERLGLDPQRKTILYAPTFYPSSMEEFGTSIGENTKKYNLIIKLHLWAFFLKNFAGIKFKGQIDLAKRMESEYDHVRFLGPEVYNIVPFYSAADVLITEASSTIYEMMAIDKPVILAKFYKLRLSHRLFPYRLYKRRLNKEMSEEMTDFCIQLEEPNELPNALQTAFLNHDPNDKKRSQYKQEMLYKLDGKASVRIRDAILKRLSRGG